MWSCCLFHLICVPAAPQAHSLMNGLSPIRRSHPLIPASIDTVAIKCGLRACQLISVMALAWASIDLRRILDVWEAKSHIKSFWDEVERIKLEVAGWGDHWQLQCVNIAQIRSMRDDMTYSAICHVPPCGMNLGALLRLARSRMYSPFRLAKQTSLLLGEIDRLPTG